MFKGKLEIIKNRQIQNNLIGGIAIPLNNRNSTFIPENKNN